MTMADRIWSLLQAGQSRQEVAEKVGCSQDYVRVVHQRRTRPEDTASARYKRKVAPILEMYGDRAAAQKAGRQAYQKARASGADCRRSRQKYGSAYATMLTRTAMANIPKAG